MQKVSGIGGSERHLATLLPALAQRGVDVHMAVLAAGEGGADRFVGQLWSAGVPVTVLPAGPDVNPVAVARMTALIRRLRPDVVHTHLIHAHTHGLAAARLAGTGVAAVTTFHAAHPPFTREPYATASRLVGRVPRRTIAISEHLGRFVVEHRLASPDRVRVIHYGIEAAPWRPPAPQQEVVVGIASRLVPEKGHADLIAALATLVRSRLRLVVAGEGPLRGALEAQAAESLPAGSYEFRGFVEDIRVFLDECDIFVFPTTPDFGEGFGMAALEASAAGRPVIGTAVGPIPEVVSDGESGLIIPPRSPAALADALHRLATDEALRRRLGEGGARRARELFGVERMVDRTIAVYEEAAALEAPPQAAKRGRVGGWRTS